VVAEAIRLMMEAMNDIYDLIFSYFNDTKHGMVTEFALAKKIIKTGHHYTGIEGMITQNGAPVENATVGMVGTNKKTMSDILGHFSMTQLKSGNHHFTVTLPDGTNQSYILNVVKGHIETHNFEF
jgi:hypothetical protein